MQRQREGDRHIEKRGKGRDGNGERWRPIILLRENERIPRRQEH